MKRPIPRAAVMALAATLLTACGLHRITVDERNPTPVTGPVQRPALTAQQPTSSEHPATENGLRQTSVSNPTPREEPSTPATATRLPAADAALLEQARTHYQKARTQIAGWSDADQVLTLLNAAESAARSGDAAGVRSLSADVLRRSDEALDVHYLLAAQVELQKVQTYTGLSDAQLERMREGEFAVASNHGQRAWNILNALSQELAKATKRYVVAAGDSLWIISGRPEVYGNPLLWPLIWHANDDVLANPNQLLTGQRLKIRSNPTIDEVVQAVDTARSYRNASVRIGEVREASP